MFRIANLIWDYKFLWIALGIIFVTTLFTNIIIGGLLTSFFLLIPFKDINRESFIILLFLGACFLATNTSGALSNFGDFRFVVIGIGLGLVAMQMKVYKFPLLYILPFSLYAAIISLTSTTSGYIEVLEGAIFLVVAVVLFALIHRAYQQKPIETQQILIGFLILFLGLNVLLLFSPEGKFFLAGRFRGVLRNPNELGLVAMFCYGFFHFMEKKKDSEFPSGFFLGCKILFVVLALLSGSRTAIFGIIFYEIIYRFFNSKLKIAFSTVLFGVVFYMVIDIGILEIIQALGLSEELRVQTLITGSGRTEVWQVAWEEIKQNPYFGQGMGYDTAFIQDYASQFIGANPARHWYAIWNSYLSLLLNVGIIGFVLYFFFVYKLFKKAQYRRTATAFIAMALFAGITESWMISSVNAFTPLFFVYWAIQSEPKL